MSSSSLANMDPVAMFAETAHALTESLELPEVLSRIAQRMLELTDAQGVSIIVPREELAEFVSHASPPPHSLIPVGFRFRPPAELIDALSGRREPLVLLDLHASPLVPVAIKERIVARDLVIVPLRVADELVGALIIAFNELPEELPVDTELLRAVGDQAAVALRNAQLYEEARRSSERLLQAEKLSAIGRVVARVAHEINNPLTTARLLTESLEAETQGQGPLEQLRALGGELDRAATVVRELLHYVHDREPRPVPIRIDELIEEVLQALKRPIRAADAHVVVERPEQPIAVRADAIGLRQVLLNLIHNAAHALVGQPDEREIVVRFARDGEADVTITVEDSGPGLPRELAARIFDPFVTTKPIGEGTGLGLAIVREIVEAHGGSVEIDWTPDGRTAFHVRLPGAFAGVLADSDGTTDSTNSVTAASAAVDRSTAPRGTHVLVIDDEVELQRALRRVLHILGCEVTSALNGEEGLELARDAEIDLILCDMRIPGIDGLELYRRLRNAAPATTERLVFMTGDTLSDELRDFITTSGRPTLAKPFGRAQLVDLIRTVGARAGE